MSIFEHDLETVVTRYRALQLRMGVHPTDKVSAKADIRQWHAEREELRLDLLAIARDDDLAHDVSGIIRHDTWMSARYARKYHPLLDASG